MQFIVECARNHQSTNQPLSVRILQQFLRFLRLFKDGEAALVENEHNLEADKENFNPHCEIDDEDESGEEDCHSASLFLEMDGVLGLGRGLRGESLSTFLSEYKQQKRQTKGPAWPSLATTYAFAKRYGLTFRKNERLDRARSGASTLENPKVLARGLNGFFESHEINHPGQVYAVDETRLSIEYQKIVDERVVVAKGTKTAASTKQRSRMISGLSIVPFVSMDGSHTMTALIGKGEGVSDCLRSLRDGDLKRKSVTMNTDSGFVLTATVKLLVQHFFYRLLEKEQRAAGHRDRPQNMAPLCN